MKTGVVLLKFGVVELEDAGGNKTEFKKEGVSGEAPQIVLRQGETLRVRENAGCDVIFPEAGAVRVVQGSDIRIPAGGAGAEKGTPVSLELLGGKLFLDIDSAKLAKEKKQFRLKTPTAILAVKGTRFFAETGEEADTAGVLQGKIVVLEIGSGKTLLINSGSAAVVKNGAISKPRKLTDEEEFYGEIFKEFAIEFEPGERANRKFETAYEAQTDPNTAIPSQHPKLIMAEKATELETGTALKITIQPFPLAPTVTVFAKTIVEIPVRLRSEPVGINFLARGTDVRRFHVSGSVKLRDKVFGIPASTLVGFPEGTPSDEWVPFFIPFQEIAVKLETEPGSITFWIDPNMRAGRAIESIVNVEEGKSEYVLEISPVMIGSRPKE